MASVNIYPEAGDGGVTKYSAVAGDWANVIAAASGTTADYTTNPASAPFASGGGVDTYCNRAFWAFDTRSLAGATIDAVVFHGYITTYNSTGETFYVVLGSQASTSQLVVDDYNNLDKGTLYGSSAIGGAGAYTITLTTGSIVTGGYTKFCMITDHDYSGSGPGADQTTNAQNFSEAGSNRPYLEITYTPAPSGNVIVGYFEV